MSNPAMKLLIWAAVISFVVLFALLFIPITVDQVVVYHGLPFHWDGAFDGRTGLPIGPQFSFGTIPNVVRVRMDIFALDLLIWFAVLFLIFFVVFRSRKEKGGSIVN